MPDRQLDEEAIFHTARRIQDPALREDYLEQVCANNTALLDRVQALLEVHEQEQDFLRSGTPEPEATVDSSPITEAPGTTIGRYRLMEQIGEGGMGVVFVAEQKRPVRRRVAMKIVKAGMDTKDAVARFEAERQALALMDHPNIAKVLDAGSTESGRPYFVMELVRGVPVTEYCDKKKLSVPERLQLFVQICQAVQHAHQKGIIHRDIKPTNVLVADHDGKPVPKVIDFGVAKATNQRLTERTIYTRLQQVIGTPMYMSPEQAEFNGLDVDTRSDIYSLGVLLYELLTGATPFDRERFAKGAYAEIQRIIRDEEPPKPSTKISVLGDTATEVSAQRRSDPKRLHQTVRGDLDWIVMKALEKDRTRRYETANGFAADLQRVLSNDPIEARPPSTAYRLRKMVARHRIALATTAIVTLALIAGLAVSLWQRSAAIAAKEEAVEAREEAEETLRMLADASIGEAFIAVLAGHSKRTRPALEVARLANASETEITVLKGLIAMNRGQYAEAMRYAEQALAASPPTHASARIAPLALMGAASSWAGRFESFESAVNELLHLQPISDTEYLLKAYALALPFPRKSLELLNEAPHVGDSTVGLFIRGQARLIMGIDQKNGDLLDKAITDLDYVEYLFGDNQSVVAWRAYAVAAAIELARFEARREDETRLIALGEKIADQASDFEQNPFVDSCLYFLYRAIGEEDLAFSAASRTGQYPSGYYALVAFACLRRYDAATASRMFEDAIAGDKDNEYFRVARAMLGPADPKGTGTVQNSIEDLLDHPSISLRHQALFALCLVSQPSDIKRYADRAACPNLPGVTTGEILSVVASFEYLAGRKTETELLQEAEGHGYSTATAHTTIGMLRLAQGKREEAHEHLRSAVATQTINFYYSEWARACVVRMEADSTWPSWIGD